MLDGFAPRHGPSVRRQILEEILLKKGAQNVFGRHGKPMSPDDPWWIVKTGDCDMKDGFNRRIGTGARRIGLAFRSPVVIAVGELLHPRSYSQVWIVPCSFTFNRWRQIKIVAAGGAHILDMKRWRQSDFICVVQDRPLNGFFAQTFNCGSHVVCLIRIFRESDVAWRRRETCGPRSDPWVMSRQDRDGRFAGKVVRLAGIEPTTFSSGG